jgi:acyl-CoA thioester hydrolase
MFISETAFVVRYAETDQMRIVHHSNYPVWYEAGRTDFIRKAGMPYSKIEEEGVLLPLIELYCRYKGAARYEDSIIVKTRVKEVSNTRVTFYYEVFCNGGEEPINTGETVHVFTSRQLRPVNVRKVAPQIHDLLVNAADPA